MLDFLKKKQPATQSSQLGNPQTQFIQQATPQEIMEVGKEVQIRDPKSGEFIYRMAMSAENRKFIFDTIQKNAGVGQRIMTLAINLTAILRQMDAEDKVRIDSEKAIELAVTKVRDDMKIDKRWGLNMALGVLERREPPDGV